MTDTPEHIKKLQLKIWLGKTPAERLKQFLQDNEDLYKLWDSSKKQQPFSGKKSNPVMRETLTDKI